MTPTHSSHPIHPQSPLRPPFVPRSWSPPVAQWDSAGEEERMEIENIK